MADLIQKSVRLPADLYEYVDSQKGKNFSDRLVRLLEDMKNGEEARRERLSDYEARICNAQERLTAYRSLIYDTVDMSRRYEALLKRLQEDIDRRAAP